MLKYILKRIIQMIPVMVLVIFIVFTINYFTPGDPVNQILGESASQEQIDAKRKELGLDDPYFVQLGRYIWGIASRFDFGNSYMTGKSVGKEIIERIPTTLKLTFFSITIATVVGMLLGVLSAIRQYSALDYASTFISLFGASMPGFWLGMMLMLIFALRLGWFPATGFKGPVYWVLPSVALSVSPISTITRTTRSSMLEVIRQDYIKTARAKGLSETVVIIKHALKNTLIPVITVIGIQVGRTLGGVIVIESIFSIPGLGSLLVVAVKNKNFPTMQGSVLFCAFCYSVINLVVDILYAVIDPRIKSQYTRKKKTKVVAAVATEGGQR